MTEEHPRATRRRSPSATGSRGLQAVEPSRDPDPTFLTLCRFFLITMR